VNRARFSTLARAELLGEIAYYDSRDVGLGKRFNMVVEEAFMRASAYPQSGVSMMADARSLRVRGFPFQLTYLVDEQGILIVAKAHNAREPLYWASRIPDRP
jgi:toxin ParE1/3/4